MYTGIGFVLLHHFWEKGRNECAGETRFEAMAFLPQIAAALCIASLFKLLTRWFSVKEVAADWLSVGNPCKNGGAHRVG